MLRKVLLYGFAFVGVLSMLLLAIDFFKQNSTAKTYLRNCENVKVGMSVEQAKSIMGDLDYNHKYRSEIWTVFNQDTAKVYYLDYPSAFGASTGTEIYFEPNTQIVTKVICEE